MNLPVAATSKKVTGWKPRDMYRPMDVRVQPSQNEMIDVHYRLFDSNTAVLNFSRTDYFSRLSNVSSTASLIDTTEFSKLIGKIKSYLNLPQNWDGYEGVTPSQSTANEAIAFLKKIPKSLLPSRAGVTGDGEICLIWDKENIFVDLGFIGEGNFFYFMNYVDGKILGEGSLQDSVAVAEFLNSLKKVHAE
jgi:hypothetical protein